MNAPGYRLGIDFGTSNTVAMLAWPDGQVRPLLFDGSPALPSAVYADANSGLLIGRDAAHAARVSPERYEPNPKRRIDEPAVLLGEAEVPTVDLIAAVLGRVVVEAGRVAGGPVGAATLTFPAAWAQTRRGILVAAAERAGLGPVSLVPEPVAAASVFVGLAGAPPGASFVVYDLGAGTFDATVVRRTANGGFDVLATEGLPQSGGLDIDAAIVGYLGAVYSTRDPQLWNRLLRPSTTAERRANRLLWEDVRSAKEMLSRASSTMIHIPLADEDAPLGRDQFEQLARPILDATVTATRAAIAAAGLSGGGVSGIFLVGGGSRIPLVATLLHQALGVAPTVVEQPELVVAQGSIGATGAVAPVPDGPTAPTSGAYGAGSAAAPTSGAYGAGPVAPVSGGGSASVPVSGIPGPYPPAPARFGPSGSVSGPSGPAGPVSAPPGQVSGPPGVYGTASVSAPPGTGGSVYGAGPSGAGSAPAGSAPAGSAPAGSAPAWGGTPGRAAVPAAPAGSAQPHGAGRRTGILVAAAVAVLLVLGLGTFAVMQLTGDDGTNTNTSQDPTGDTTGNEGGNEGGSGSDSGKAGSRPSADYFDEGTTWTTSAEAYNDRVGSSVAFRCPPGGTPATVWGSEPFTSDSSVCTAAVHAGWISLEDGGWVKIQMQEGVDSYQGSEQFGISTTDYGPFEWAFSFTG